MARPTPSNDHSLVVFAHELREPLASILFAVQLMTEGDRDPSATREMCGIVERQSRYLARLIDDVLEVSRGCHDKLCLQADWFDLGMVLTSAVETVAPLLKNRGHRLALFLPQGQVYVMADSLRVQQVVVNLLNNAVKYTEPGGSIRLAVEATANQLVIEVQDNGVGISREFLPRVFDLFRQGAEPTNGVFPGLGIGLALVKSLVELHGGTVSAHSDGEGTGSTFAVRLPSATRAICQVPANQGVRFGSLHASCRVVVDPMVDA